MIVSNKCNMKINTLFLLCAILLSVSCREDCPQAQSITWTVECIGATCSDNVEFMLAIGSSRAETISISGGPNSIGQETFLTNETGNVIYQLFFDNRVVESGVIDITDPCDGSQSFRSTIVL